MSHRFAGSGDRAAIGNLVFDCLRTRASAAYAMGEASPRALVLRTLVTGWGLGPEEVAALADGGRHAPEPLSEAELAGLEARASRRGAGLCAGRLSGMARARVRARLRRPRRPRRERHLAAPRARRSQGQHAQGRPRQSAEGAAPLRGSADPALALGVRIEQAPGPARALMSRPSRVTAKAGTRCRTRARSSPRCCRARDPASRLSISAPGPGARPWRSRR